MSGLKRNYSKNNYSKNINIAKTVFIGIPLLSIILLIIYPTYFFIKIMLSRFDLSFMREPVFIGLTNFINIFSDIYFWNSVFNTFIIVVFAVLIEFALGLCLALLLGKIFFGGRIIKSLFIIPMMLPPIVAGLNFKLIFDTFGPINEFLKIFGIDPINWLGNPFWARTSVIIADVWQWTPFIFIILLAGLQSIPEELNEAAKVDGASGFNLFRFITWPLLVPSATVALAIRAIDAVKIFDVPFLLTAGGPGGATEVLSLYIYRATFRFGTMGYGAAMASIMLIGLSLLAVLIIKIINLSNRMGWD